LRFQDEKYYFQVRIAAAEALAEASRGLAGSRNIDILFGAFKLLVSRL
jgi:hypothetical protein